MSMLIWLSLMLAQPPATEKEPERPAATTTEADDPKTLRERINDRMKQSEEQLRRKNLGDDTRRIQEGLLRDIDKLLELLRKPPPSPPASPNPENAPPSKSGGDPQSDNTARPPSPDQTGGNGSRSQQPGGSPPRPGPGNAGREKQSGERAPSSPGESGKERRERRRAARNANPDFARGQPGSPTATGRPQPGAPGSRPGDAPGNPGTNPDSARGATMPLNPNDRVDRLSDMSRDVWGHLPPTLRQEVDHYYRERFMPRYRELIQQYYNRLAEDDRQRKDRR